MKKRVSLFVLLICAFVLNAQNFSLEGDYSFDVNCGIFNAFISDENITFDLMEDPRKKISMNFDITHIEGFSYIKLNKRIPQDIKMGVIFPNGEKGLPFKNSDDKILFFCGYNKEYPNAYFLGYMKGMYDENIPIASSKAFRKGCNYRNCSSFLTEGKKKYQINNLNRIELETPWVEGVDGPGIGEFFEIENSSNCCFKTLIIMNGYISIKKPYLYKQNNRIKKIKVKGLKSGKEKILDVLDTPHPQTVDISFITEPEDIRVEIADVYKGTKYDDTCIHFLRPDVIELIPYEDNIEK